MEKQHRFIFLDGLRGIAAMAVVICHMTVKTSQVIFPSASIAVDLFFCLSGFVIAWSYSKRLEKGMPFFEFVKKRLIRLYPMFIIGLGLGAVVFLINRHYGFNNLSPKEALISLSLNIFYLPYFSKGLVGVFPLNIPSWSLFFELFANIAFFFTIRLSKNLLFILTILLGLVMVYAGIEADTSPGWRTANFLGGFPRVGYSFMVGVFIYKQFKQSQQAFTINPVVITALLLMLFLIPKVNAWTYIWIVTTLLLIPYMVWSSTRVEIKSEFLVKSMSYMGWISYPIYCLHTPLISLSNTFITWGIEKNYLMLIKIFIVIAISHALAKLIDEPTRNYLSKKLFQKE